MSSKSSHALSYDVSFSAFEAMPTLDISVGAPAASSSSVAWTRSTRQRNFKPRKHKSAKDDFAENINAELVEDEIEEDGQITKTNEEEDHDVEAALSGVDVD